MARVQEKEMKEDGTYYNTKYKLKDRVQVKLPGWDGLKQGRIVKVHKNKKRSLVKYDIKLNKKYKGKQLYKKVPSRRIKSSEEHEEKELLKELKNGLIQKAERKRSNGETI